MGVPPRGLTLNPLNPIMTTKPSSMTLGILASILAALLFTLMDVSAKAVSYLGTGELTFVRGLVGLFFLPLIAKRESLPRFSGKDRLLLHTRGIFRRDGHPALFLLSQRADTGRCGDPCPARRVLHVHPFADLSCDHARGKRACLALHHRCRCGGGAESLGLLLL